MDPKELKNKWVMGMEDLALVQNYSRHWNSSTISHNLNGNASAPIGRSKSGFIKKKNIPARNEPEQQKSE